MYFKFIELLQTNGSQQHVKDPTHYLGHTLDVISRDTSDVVCNVKVPDIGLRDDKGDVIHDHFAVVFNIKQAAPLLKKTVVQYYIENCRVSMLIYYVMIFNHQHI